MAQKPSIPKGTRDFSPAEMAKRNYIFDTIKDVFRLYGFKQIETPAVEKLSTLMGKYGDEGDKLLFKILNSGNYLDGVNEQDLADKNHVALLKQLSEKGLRYDLTVPFARFVVQHRDEIQMPFKRFQIQPVWRADRPQKGRYREFYQCDADVVGSNSLLNEVELITLIDTVFAKFGINVAIKLNNRKVLTAIAEIIGAEDKITDITVAIDKIDKIGLEKVSEELRERGLSQEQIATISPLLTLQGDNEQKLHELEKVIGTTEVGKLGIEELRFVLGHATELGLKAQLDLDISLARGLNYYTGTIIEVKALDVAIGSITGGGRYDNLTGVFGMDGLSGVGISFGADRIYDVLNTLNLYPESLSDSVKVLFVNFGQKESVQCLRYMTQLRASGISCELYPDATKLKKQLTYANKLQIRYVAIVGESELENGTITLRDMDQSQEQHYDVAQLIQVLK